MRATPCTRRRFLGHSALSGTALLAGNRVLGANNDIRVAVVGLGNKGRGHLRQFAKQKGARVVALCDVDPGRLAGAAKEIPGAFTSTDARKTLDRKDIDAVVIATPDHWHALLAVWACQSGRDVYVEKPVSHNVIEGRKIVEAAVRHGRVVQAGTQNRSMGGLREAAEYIREGNIGKILWGHVVWYELRGSIGRVPPHIPKGVDYDLYCGPAEVRPLRRKRLHYDWHWVWPTGTGDLGNSGIHAFDMCRMFVGHDGLPPRAVCVGGRFAVDDAGETPNTQLTLLQYPSMPILIENRNLPVRPGVRGMDVYHQIREGFVVQCEGGYFAGLRGGGWIYDEKGKRVKQFAGWGGASHEGNFLEAVRKRDRGLLTAPIEEGHVSSACCHLGNLSYRLGKTTDEAAVSAAMISWDLAVKTVGSLEKHLRVNGVDLGKTPMVCGPWLEVNTETNEIAAISGQTDGPAADEARRLSRGTYRAPYAMPKTV